MTAGGAGGRPPGRHSILEVRDLHVWFSLPGGGELHAVQGVGFELGAGERFGLVGESGCGKTTSILAMMGLLPPNASVAGEVRLAGTNILAGGEDSVRPHRWTEVAMVFQGAMNALNPVRTVAAQIAEPILLHKESSSAAARKRAGELLEMVGIPAASGSRFPHEFSGGMRQRAAIAMALACEPKVLLADEPTTALDVMVQAQILELLVRLSDELGLALVLVTHDLPVVAQICQRAGVMYAGEIVETGTTDALFHATRHPYTRLLFAATPDLYGTDAVASIPGTPPRLDEPVTGCPFRPRCDSVIDQCQHDRPVLAPVPAATPPGIHDREGSEVLSEPESFAIMQAGGDVGHMAACHRAGGSG
ncbi:MAG TPA: ABC transporter ATP-binding protein [Streptosporangiaceae bacterium]